MSENSSTKIENKSHKNRFQQQYKEEIEARVCSTNSSGRIKQIVVKSLQAIVEMVQVMSSYSRQTQKKKEIKQK